MIDPFDLDQPQQYQILLSPGDVVIRHFDMQRIQTDIMAAIGFIDAHKGSLIAQAHKRHLFNAQKTKSQTSWCNLIYCKRGLKSQEK